MSGKQFRIMSMIVIGLVALFGLEFAAYAASGAGISGVATRALSQLSAVAKLMTAGAYIAGFGFGIAAVVKFKAHKDNPTQVPISQPIVYLFVAAALLFIPSVFSSVGHTLYASGTQASISGVKSF